MRASVVARLWHSNVDHILAGLPSMRNASCYLQEMLDDYRQAAQ